MNRKTRQDQIIYLNKLLGERDDVKRKVTTTDTDGHELTSDELMTDLLINCLHFVYNEGTSKEQMEFFMTFYRQLLTDAINQELPILDTVALVKNKFKDEAFCNHFPPIFLKSAIDFICSNLIQHYHLILNAMLYSREQVIHEVESVIDVPPLVFEELSKSTPYDKWITETKLKESEEKFRQEEEKIDSNFLQSTTMLEAELCECLEQIDSLVSSRLDIKEMIKTIVEKHAHLTEAELQSSLLKSKQQVLIKLEKSKILKSPSKINLKQSNASRHKK